MYQILKQLLLKVKIKKLIDFMDTNGLQVPQTV